jgi:hypothetical protein
MTISLTVSDMQWLMGLVSTEIEMGEALLQVMPQNKEISADVEHAHEILTKVALAVMVQKTKNKNEPETMEIDPSRN